jgi:hypothetical protein
MFSTISPVSRPAVPEMMAQNNKTPESETAELENLDRQRQTQMATRTIRNSSSRHLNNHQTGSGPDMTYAARADKRVRLNATPSSNLKAFKVSAIFPGKDNYNVSRKSKIAVHFSEPVNPSTINNINISVFGKQTRVEGKVIYDRHKNRAIFDPASPLDANTRYKVIISNKIKSKMGEKLASAFSWEFATAENLRQKYVPRKTAEADAAFYIPLVDSKLKKEPGQVASRLNSPQTTHSSSFNYVDPRHWAFKSMRHISNRGILNSFPFAYTDSVTRYEIASAINSALNNLKDMQHSPTRPRLKIADMVELQQLIVEFRNELKSYIVNTRWFEAFLQKQGVDLRQIEMKVRKLNKG